MLLHAAQDTMGLLVMFAHVQPLLNCQSWPVLRSLCALFMLESSPGEMNDPVAVGGPCSVESMFQGFAFLISK